MSSITGTTPEASPPPAPPKLHHLNWAKWEKTANKTAKICGYIFLGIGIAALSLADGFPALVGTILPIAAVAGLIFLVGAAAYVYYKTQLGKVREENAAAIVDHLQKNHTTQGLNDLKQHGQLSTEMELDCQSLAKEEEKSIEATSFINNFVEVFPNLKKLTIKNFNSSGSVHLGMLAKLPLEELTISDCDLTDEQLSVVGQMSGLKKLTLTGCAKITEKGFKSLEKLNIEELSIQVGTKNNNETLNLENEKGKALGHCLEKWSRLKTLTVVNAEDDFVAAAMTKASVLEKLNIQNCEKLTGKCFSETKESKVKHIQVNFCVKFEALGYRHLSALKNIQTVAFDKFTGCVLDKEVLGEEFRNFRKFFHAPDKDEIAFEGFWRHKENYTDI